MKPHPGIHLLQGNLTADGKPTDPRARVLLDAAEAVLKDRNTSYGEPEDNFYRIAGKWADRLGIPISPQTVAWMMIDLKSARSMVTPDLHDNAVDTAGYAATIPSCSNVDVEPREWKWAPLEGTQVRLPPTSGVIPSAPSVTYDPEIRPDPKERMP